MATEIRVPTLGESVTEATVGKWFKKVGDAIAADGRFGDGFAQGG
ncbi:biotin/lipoyl-containing protein, partial [Mesorhizobium sp.]